MKKDVNKCIFIGRLGKDVEYRENENTKACNFSIACSDDYKDKSGNEVNRTDWVNIVAFGRLAEICSQYLKKGSQVYIEGRQKTRKWTDNNNQDRYTTEIVANEMQMLDSKGDNGQNGAPQRAQQSRPQQVQQPQQNQAPAFDDFDDSDMQF